MRSQAAYFVLRCGGRRVTDKLRLADAVLSAAEIRHSRTLMKFEVPEMLRLSGRHRHLRLLRELLAEAYRSTDGQYMNDFDALCHDIGARQDFELLRWVAGHAPRPSGAHLYPVFWHVAIAGSIEMLRWLKDTGEWGSTPEVTSHMLAAAAKLANRDNMRYLMENGCPWSTLAAQCLVRRGDVEALEWAAGTGCPFDADYLCREAAAAGRLEALQWLRSRGCPWGEDVARVAVRARHAEVLQWAVDHGCPHDREAADWLCASALW